MLLCEHPDFEQAVIRAADHFARHGLRAAITKTLQYLVSKGFLVKDGHRP